MIDFPPFVLSLLVMLAATLWLLAPIPATTVAETEIGLFDPESDLGRTDQQVEAFAGKNPAASTRSRNERRGVTGLDA